MKKILFAIFAIAIFTSCVSAQMHPVDRLTVGMTTREVRMRLGLPDRILESGWRGGQFLEVLQYTIWGDRFALVFWNDFLTSTEFLFADRGFVFISPMRPPSFFPPRGRPIIIVNRPPVNQRPGTNSRPSNSGRPSSRPSTSGRSDTNTNSATPNRNNNSSSSSGRESGSGRESTSGSRDASSSGRTDGSGRTSTDDSRNTNSGTNRESTSGRSGGR